MDPDGVVRLAGAILRGTPSLPNTACRGWHELYDDVPGQSYARVEPFSGTSEAASRSTVRLVA